MDEVLVSLGKTGELVGHKKPDSRADEGKSGRSALFRTYPTAPLA